MGDSRPHQGGGKKLTLAVAIANGDLASFDCETCTEAERRDRGCEQEITDKQLWMYLQGDKDPIKRCPRALVTARDMLIVSLESTREAHGWPDGGATLDQPQSLFDAICVVSQAKAKARKDGK